MRDDKLSINNMVEFAMGISMASLFTKAMSNAFDNTQRLMNNNELSCAQKYIYAIVEGAQSGPYSLFDVVDMIKSGTITPETYLWKAGMPQWMLAKNITDIAPNFELIPPPITSI